MANPDSLPQHRKRSTSHASIGRPPTSIRTFPGSLRDDIRAWIRANIHVPERLLLPASGERERDR